MTDPNKHHLVEIARVASHIMPFVRPHVQPIWTTKVFLLQASSVLLAAVLSHFCSFCSLPFASISISQVSIPQAPAHFPTIISLAKSSRKIPLIPLARSYFFLLVNLTIPCKFHGSLYRTLHFHIQFTPEECRGLGVPKLQYPQSKIRI